MLCPSLQDRPSPFSKMTSGILSRMKSLIGCPERLKAEACPEMCRLWIVWIKPKNISSKIKVECRDDILDRLNKQTTDPLPLKILTHTDIVEAPIASWGSETRSIVGGDGEKCIFRHRDD